MSIPELANTALPRRFRPFVAVATLACITTLAWAQLQARVSNLEVYGPEPVRYRLERMEQVQNRIAWKLGINTDDLPGVK